MLSKMVRQARSIAQLVDRAYEMPEPEVWERKRNQWGQQYGHFIQPWDARRDALLKVPYKRIYDFPCGDTDDAITSDPWVQSDIYSLRRIMYRIHVILGHEEAYGDGTW